jgi:DNA-binding response OmpR family regulator
MNNWEAAIKDASDPHASLSYDPTSQRPLPKVFVVCDQSDTAPVWGYILRQRSLNAILEPSPDKAVERLSAEILDLIVIDTDVARNDPLQLCRKFREVSVAPLLLFLPTYHEMQVIDAYAAGVDEVIIKPISPPIFRAKVSAWLRRSWTVPVKGLGFVKAGRHRLDPTHRCIVNPDGVEVNLTNLEFRLLLLLMSRPGEVFSTDHIIDSIWGGYGSGDHVLLKNVVYRLRRKIEVDPSRPALLQTRPGGYSFQG